MYRAQFTSAAIQNLKDLPKSVRRTIKSDLQQKVVKDPFGCSEELSRALTGFRSFHFGPYRIVYRVFDDFKIIAIVGIGMKTGDPETDIYTRLEKLSGVGKLSDRFLKGLRFFSQP